MEPLNHFMYWWQAIILGVLQGFTEYLPVSSSGHLAVGELIFGLHVPVSIDVLLHLATIIPTIWVFREKLGSLLRSFCLLARHIVADAGRRIGFRCGNGATIPPNRSLQVADDGRYIALVLLITLFTFIVGYPQKNLGLKFQAQIVAGAFLFTAFLLMLQYFLLRHRHKNQVGKKDGIVCLSPISQVSRLKIFGLGVCLGIAQGIAAVPGVSRSGLTISMALLLGFKRREAGELSFIISIPVIVGAVLLDIQEITAIVGSGASIFPLLHLLGAFVAACISGFVALRWLLLLLNKGNFHFFAIYLVLFSGFVFWYFS
ncbi:MAG: undecaprenyl-diphosphate phosphatase [Spirochaetota bacterium]